MKVTRFIKCTTRVGVGLAALGALVFVANSYADTVSSGLTLSGVGGHIQNTVSNIAKILSNVALIAGIGLILAAFFKFHQHKLNPTQVPLSQGITLLLIGTGLTLFPIMLPTARNTIAGTSASISNLSGKNMVSIIGTS